MYLKVAGAMLLLAFSAGSPAQGPGGMSQQDMQNMMQGMQKMQACMQSVDQAELKKFETRGQQMEREVKSLCAAGKRDAAQQKAMAFGKEVAANPSMKKMGECSQMMAGMMPKMPFLQQVEQQSESNRHICDQ